MTLRFDRIGNNIELDPQKKYTIPETPKGLRATHVGLKNGYITFFWSPDDITLYKSKTGKWLFIGIPVDGVKALAFPWAIRTDKGWDYGIMSANGYKRVDA